MVITEVRSHEVRFCGISVGLAEVGGRGVAAKVRVKSTVGDDLFFCSVRI